MKGLNANEVLANLECVMEKGKSVRIDDVYEMLEIFDWWTDNLSVTKQKEMYRFLNLAIELGYTGYVCFKVGASGCANGMWAHKEESTDGYSPNGECLYRSFSPDYVYYNAKLEDGTWLADKEESYDAIKRASTLKKKLAK